MPPWGQPDIPLATFGSLKLFRMTILEMRDAYRKSLTALYGQNEIDDMFKRVIHFYFDWSPLMVGLEPHRKLDEESYAVLDRVKAALQQAEPLQYILETTHFFGLKLKLNRSVLIPRPETEELVDWVLNENEEVDKTVWDLCTGSGCIALALKSTHPQWKLTGVDVSPTALALARENAKLLGLDVRFECQDIVTWRPRNTTDTIVANPPYVLPTEKVDMHPNVLTFEPALALFVPENDPLVFYRAILVLGREVLNDNGTIYFEINPLCRTELLALGKTLGYVHSIVKKDIFGKERFIKFST